MNDDNDDELDRALFALALEEPPAGLREAILAATVDAPVLEPAPLRPWEAWGLASALAVTLWLALWVLHGEAGTLSAALANAGAQTLGLLERPATLAWLAVGGATAFWLTQANLVPAAPARPPVRR